MNILYLITGLGGGGAEKVVVELAEQMFLHGHDVKIAFLKGDVIIRPQYSEIELIYLGLEDIKGVYKAYRHYQKVIINFKPNVVHAHMVHANIFARVSRKFCSIPRLICSAHSNNEGGRLRMLAYQLTHALSDLTTNVSQSASEDFERLGAVPKGGIYTIYNGINLKKFKYNSKSSSKIKAELGIDENTRLFLAVGRMHEAKNYPNLLHAFSKLKHSLGDKKIPKLLIAGDGDLRFEVEQLIKELDLDQNVILLGRRNDIPDLMSAADVFVLSSSFEGFGLVVAEAMACEAFVVATDCGGVKEVLGGCGILVPSHDSDKLANALKNALEMDHFQVKNNNMKALEFVKKNFNLEGVVNQWLSIYAK